MSFYKIMKIGTINIFMQIKVSLVSTMLGWCDNLFITAVLCLIWLLALLLKQVESNYHFNFLVNVSVSPKFYQSDFSCLEFNLQLKLQSCSNIRLFSSFVTICLIISRKLGNINETKIIPMLIQGTIRDNEKMPAIRYINDRLVISS